MSISFKPTSRNLQAIRDIIAQNTTINPGSLPDDTLNNVIEYCWNTFTNNNRYAVAAHTGEAKTRPTSSTSAYSSATTKP